MVMAGSKGGSPDPMKFFNQWMSGNMPSAGGSRNTSGLQGDVYMGTRDKQVRARGYGDHTRTVKVPKVVSADDAYKQFFKWGEKKRQDFIAQGILGGLLNEGAGVMEASRVWKTMVTEAAAYNDAGQQVSPWDIMSSYVKSSGGQNAWVQKGVFEINTQTGEQRYVGPGTYLGDGRAQQTDTRVDLTDPRTAQTIAMRAFQQAMGRNPNQGELTTFAAALAKAEKSNPISATTTTQYNMETGQVISQDSTTSGGLTAEARAMMGENQAKKDPEYGAYQAATTYQNALMQAVYGAPE